MIKFENNLILFNALYYLHDRCGIDKISIDSLYDYERLIFCILKDKQIKYECLNRDDYIIQDDCVKIELYNERLYYVINNIEKIKKNIEKTPTELFEALNNINLLEIIKQYNKMKIKKF